MIIAAYLVIISLVAVYITVADKKKAKKGQWRIKESTLLLVSALGGSVAMYITMKKIRHKTQHSKFMIGIPAIMVAQAALIIALIVLL
ncbi:MAG: DUF1294 domain-containing protein [Clostridia bacterium]|nr:DUF1294 domain-containing protein [Clostridia bacterium]